MDDGTRDLVRRRAGDRCEYCLLPQEASPLLTFHVEHIIARQHGGNDSINNLALACDRCNAYKGPNLSTVSHRTGEIIKVFNPRNDVWPEHFRIVNGMVNGITETGEATVRLLNMNAPRRVQLRRLTR